jgi:NADPH-dependent 2,4-dienoyl-CoA reductase/sulfur reductase-like enzyme
MHCDLIIIGAGPAGMAAAATAAQIGLTVVVLDEQPRPGGQIYRDVDRVAPLRGDILGRDFTEGTALTAGLDHPNIHHIAGAVVWSVEEAVSVHYTRAGQSHRVTGKRILLATGALERPMPLPGWTLPGVMTVGAGQIMLKQSGLVSARAVLVGAGPLLYLLAVQMLRAGAPPLALVETQTKGDALRAIRHVLGALHGWRDLRNGLAMLYELWRGGVPRYLAATDIAIEGAAHAEALRFVSGGKAHRIAAGSVFLHHGVVPNTQAARTIGIAHRWDAGQACFAPELDVWGQTAVKTVFIAGDGARIGGAKVARIAGALAALQIAQQLGRITAPQRDQKARSLVRRLQAERAIRPFLDAAYPPMAQALSPQDNTIVCRCEEVTAGDIRRSAQLGCLGPNQAKAFCRAGMGPCQGRYCGLTVSAVLAQENMRSMDETGYFRIRSPIKPVTLAELASAEDTQGHE